MSFGFLVSVVRRIRTGVVASMLLAVLGFLGLYSVSVSGLGFVASGCITVWCSCGCSGYRFVGQYGSYWL